MNQVWHPLLKKFALSLLGQSIILIHMVITQWRKLTFRNFALKRKQHTKVHMNLWVINRWAPLYLWAMGHMLRWEFSERSRQTIDSLKRESELLELIADTSKNPQVAKQLKAEACERCARIRHMDKAGDTVRLAARFLSRMSREPSRLDSHEEVRKARDRIETALLCLDRVEHISIGTDNAVIIAPIEKPPSIDPTAETQPGAKEGHRPPFN